MNALDLVILAVVGLAALLGLQSGILRRVSGTGGLILGVLLAIQHKSRVAVMLVEQIEGDLPRQVVAFVAIVLAVIVIARLAAILFKRLLGVLAIGWLDHAAGALGGAAVGTVLAGTAVFLLTGADIAQTRDSIRLSVLTPEVTRASLIASPDPWCSTLAESGPRPGKVARTSRDSPNSLSAATCPRRAPSSSRTTESVWSRCSRAR